MPRIKLWGFNGSTYVRTIRMLLAEKGVTDYEQVPVDVLKGEPKTAEHLTRHPFGKVPVVDVDDFRVFETPAIARYLNAVLPGVSCVPSDPRNAARMDMIVSIIDSYGYGPMVGGVAAYHLFPDFVGGRNDAVHRESLEKSKYILGEILKIKGNSPYLAGDDVSVADFVLAPILAYLAMTPHQEEFLALQGLGDWWSLISNRDSFRVTQP